MPENGRPFKCGESSRRFFTTALFRNQESCHGNGFELSTVTGGAAFRMCAIISLLDSYLLRIINGLWPLMLAEWIGRTAASEQPKAGTQSVSKYRQVLSDYQAPVRRSYPNFRERGVNPIPTQVKGWGSRSARISSKALLNRVQGGKRLHERIGNGNRADRLRLAKLRDSTISARRQMVTCPRSETQTGQGSSATSSVPRSRVQKRAPG